LYRTVISRIHKGASSFLNVNCKPIYWERTLPFNKNILKAYSYYTCNNKLRWSQANI